MVVVQDSLESITSAKKIYLARSAGFIPVVGATVLKDLIMFKRYKADLIGQIIRSVMFIGVFALFATSYVFEGLNLSFKETLLFYLTGFMLIVYDSVTLWTPLNSVTNDLYNGVLEYLYSSPNSRLGYFVGNIMAAAIISSVILIPLVIFLVFFYKLSLITILTMLFTLLVTLFVLVAFGVMFAMLGIMYRQVSSIAGILNMLFQFLAGFIFPVTVMPKFVQYIAYSLPYTWGIDLIRYYTIENWVPLLPVAYEWTILVGMGLFLWMITVRLLKSVEKHAKKNGLHLI